mmetsp:Transcript_75175/g.168338  ORF Transcript_75175/g.168338 Transcript_75175/m.168338 type:complete len:242 (-) Transcript_75175:9140-9865(-)
MDGRAHRKSKVAGHEDHDATAVRFHEATARQGHRPAELRGPTARQLVSVRACCRLHRSELPDGGLIQVVCCADKHDLRLAVQNRVDSDCCRLHGRRTSTHWRLDRTRGREEQHVQPSCCSVDEALLKDVTLHALGIRMVPMLEHLLEAVETANARAESIAHLRQVHVLVELVGIHHATLPQRLGAAHQCVERHTVHLSDDVLWDAEVLGVPVARHLRADPAIGPERARHEDLGALEHAHRP